MILSTTPTIQGHNIETYYGIVTGEVIIGANVLKDFMASIHDFFGGRAGSYENVLIEAKNAALKEMEERATAMGANAIVSIDLDYETVGQANSMLMVSCSGTAVKIS
ncbi:MAG: heavy metal-binding domain-containing protein [Bacteroidales bacterium]|nr:heavy metal-binding domain-containing protein [Bacteroidales bacterium]